MADGAIKYVKYLNIAANALGGFGQVFNTEKTLNQSFKINRDITTLESFLGKFVGLNLLYISFDYLFTKQDDLSPQAWKKKILLYGVYEIGGIYLMYKYPSLYEDNMRKVLLILGGVLCISNLYVGLFHVPKKEKEKENDQ